MRSDADAEKAHSERIEAVLKPLGFHAVRPGVFAQDEHPWLHFDLTATDAALEVLLPRVMDMLWDQAVAEGVRRNQKAIQSAIGLK